MPDQKLFLGRRVPELATITAGLKGANREHRRHHYISLSKATVTIFFFWAIHDGRFSLALHEPRSVT